MRFISVYNIFFLYRTGRREGLSHYCLLPERGTQRAELLNTWMVIHPSIRDRKSDLTETSRLVTGHSASGKPILSCRVPTAHNTLLHPALLH